MTRRVTFIILALSAIPTIAFSQETYFDKKVKIKTKPVEDVNRIKVDTLTRYYDSLVNISTSLANEMELYRVTSTSFVPAVKTIKYFSVSNNSLISLEILGDDEFVFIRRRTYDNDFKNKFRELIDSAFWNYKSPSTSQNEVIHDGHRTKIEGLKSKTVKALERTNPTKYDTLFRLPESFFRKY
jgi:hypothetical protein